MKEMRDPSNAIIGVPAGCAFDMRDSSTARKTYGPDAIPLVTENPYRLVREIAGMGFKSADVIAERLGIGKFMP